MIEEVAGALWTRALIEMPCQRAPDACRIVAAAAGFGAWGWFEAELAALGNVSGP